MRSIDIERMFGGPDVKVAPRQPYSPTVCEFLDALSKEIREDARARAYPDLTAFSFWIRRANVQKLKRDWKGRGRRIGKGLAFHIAPSNVPINFAYTLAFGLLAGNSNIVKAPSKRFPQTEILCEIMERTARTERFRWAREQNAVILYDRRLTEVTEELSKACDARVIWGGDATIARIRQSELPPRASEITFADRYSCGIVSIEKALEASEEEMRELAQKFYNDTYLMDQNACSSPHFIFWHGDKTRMGEAKERFWRAVHRTAQKKYDLADAKVSEKYTMLCEMADWMGPARATRHGNLLYVVELAAPPETIAKLRGKFGLFFDCHVKGLEELAGAFDDGKIQTCAVYGVDAEELADALIRKHVRGVDRIVPFGSALSIGTIWDGHDVIGELSRCMVCM